MLACLQQVRWLSKSYASARTFPPPQMPEDPEAEGPSGNEFNKYQALTTRQSALLQAWNTCNNQLGFITHYLTRAARCSVRYLYSSGVSVVRIPCQVHLVSCRLPKKVGAVCERSAHLFPNFGQHRLHRISVCLIRDRRCVGPAAEQNHRAPVHKSNQCRGNCHDDYCVAQSRLQDICRWNKTE